VSFLAKIFGGVAGETIASPVEAVGNVLDKLFTSDEEKAAADAVMEKLRQQPHLLQGEINKIEAAHRSVFVAGWRPWIGWICGFGIATYFLPQHVLAAILWVRMAWNADALPPYPIGPDALLELTLAMLGLGLLRSAEKFGKVAK